MRIKCENGLRADSAECIITRKPSSRWQTRATRNPFRRISNYRCI